MANVARRHGKNHAYAMHLRYAEHVEINSSSSCSCSSSFSLFPFVSLNQLKTSSRAYIQDVHDNFHPPRQEEEGVDLLAGEQRE